MKLEIAEMKQEDIPAVAALEREIFSMPWSENGFLSALSSSDTLYLTVRADNRVIGYCGLLQSFEEADITNVAVSPAYRGRGVGYRMLSELMEAGKTRGIERYTLEVRISNQAALALYEKLGFASVGVRKNFYEKPKEDAVIMWTA
ncbi:MAG: ribosomal protein S18-alanine N-acetyltransferase [Candidatus Choladocola sp.]|nr:ribosomal protein S18-alanine N-acetyltransferase [Candidatus Choladocola sp.]